MRSQHDKDGAILVRGAMRSGDAGSAVHVMTTDHGGAPGWAGPTRSGTAGKDDAFDRAFSG